MAGFPPHFSSLLPLVSAICSYSLPTKTVTSYNSYPTCFPSFTLPQLLHQGMMSLLSSHLHLSILFSCFDTPILPPKHNHKLYSSPACHLPLQQFPICCQLAPTPMFPIECYTPSTSQVLHSSPLLPFSLFASTLSLLIPKVIP